MGETIYVECHGTGTSVGIIPSPINIYIRVLV